MLRPRRLFQLRCRLCFMLWMMRIRWLRREFMPQSSFFLDLMSCFRHHAGLRLHLLNLRSSRIRVQLLEKGTLTLSFSSFWPFFFHRARQTPRVKIQRWLLIAGEELEENVGHDLHWKVKNRIVKRVQFGLETGSLSSQLQQPISNLSPPTLRFGHKSRS
jgi:hypothetical protein